MYMAPEMWCSWVLVVIVISASMWFMSDTSTFTFTFVCEIKIPTNKSFFHILINVKSCSSHMHMHLNFICLCQPKFPNYLVPSSPNHLYFIVLHIICSHCTIELWIHETLNLAIGKPCCWMGHQIPLIPDSCNLNARLIAIARITLYLGLDDSSVYLHLLSWPSGFPAVLLAILHP